MGIRQARFSCWNRISLFKYLKVINRIATAQMSENLEAGYDEEVEAYLNQLKECPMNRSPPVIEAF